MAPNKTLIKPKGKAIPRAKGANEALFTASLSRGEHERCGRAIDVGRILPLLA